MFETRRNDPAINAESVENMAEGHMDIPEGFLEGLTIMDMEQSTEKQFQSAGFPHNLNIVAATTLASSPLERDVFEDAPERLENIEWLRTHTGYPEGVPPWRLNSMMSPTSPLSWEETSIPKAVKDAELFNTTLAPSTSFSKQETSRSDSSMDGIIVETIELAQMKQENVDWDFIVRNFDKTSRPRQNSLVRHRISKSVSMSARSVKSNSTYYSALSRTGSRKGTPRKRLQKDNAYSKLLQSKSLWPVDPLVENDWSGRGQHVEFQRYEKKIIDRILDVHDVLGSTSTAIVESVRCKRILLARKTIRCGRLFTWEKAIEEVAQLNRLDHSHVVQVIGTYTIGNHFSILMYPVAEYNLESFIHDLDPRTHSADNWIKRIFSLLSFYGCLAHAVEHIHSKMTKHMDIKPQNILVRDMRSSTQYIGNAFKIYIADFGISRSYETLDACETEGPTMFTRKYAAPEVVDRDKRGLSADIFSLGCVFVEIGAAYDHFVTFDRANGSARPVHTISKAATSGECNPLQIVHDALASNENGDTSYQANIDAVCEVLRSNKHQCHFKNSIAPLLAKIPQMLSSDPLRRPLASCLVSTFVNCIGTVKSSCCVCTADSLEGAPLEPTLDEESEPDT